MTEAKEPCPKSVATEISGYSYDKAGNETGIVGYSDPASTTFSYNNLNQLQSLTPSSGGEEALTYFGTGQSDLTGVGATTLQESAFGATKRVNGSGTTYYARTPDGTLVDERLPGGAAYNPIYDAHGSVIGLLNGSGELVQTIRYGPYGENATTAGTLAYSATTDAFMFQGGYHMPAGGNAGSGNVPNGLYHFGARYYDPTVGTWTQSDPTTAGWEYEFAGDDPINNEDPSGCVRAKSPSGRWAEHQCDVHRESLPAHRRGEIGDFTGEIRWEAGKKGEWHYELQYKAKFPPLWAATGNPLGPEAWCSIVFDEVGKNKYHAVEGPHFRPYPTIGGNPDEV